MFIFGYNGDYAHMWVEFIAVLLLVLRTIHGHTHTEKTLGCSEQNHLSHLTVVSVPISNVWQCTNNNKTRANVERFGRVVTFGPT